MSTPAGLVLTHECPAGLCTEQIDPDMLMCPRHWYLVPKPLRTAVGTPGAAVPVREARPTEPP